jgi:predicted transcriptional regulator
MTNARLHPMKSATIAALRRLAQGPLRRYAVNPGISNRLLREALIEPGKDGTSNVYQITEAGRDRLEVIDAARGR